MRPKLAARAEESLLFRHDLVPALREMRGANPVPDTVNAPEVRQAQIAYKSYRSARGAVVAPRRTKLIRQCRDRYDVDYEVGMRKRGNPDDLRGRRIVVAAELWARLSKELVHHVLTEVGRAQYATSGKWSFHEKRKLDQVV